MRSAAQEDERIVCEESPRRRIIAFAHLAELKLDNVL